MKMPDSVYNEYLNMIRDYNGTKEYLQSIYDSIYAKYDDGSDMLYRLDKYQSKWVMNLHQK